MMHWLMLQQPLQFEGPQLETGHTQVPPMHSPPAGHAEQTLPCTPHCFAVGGSTQKPLPSQQPAGQFAGLHGASGK